nr:hypothetical protein [uncultured Hyphomonas sp.]
MLIRSEIKVIAESYMTFPCLLDLPGTFIDYDDDESEYIPDVFWAKSIYEFLGEKFVCGEYLDPEKPDREERLRMRGLLHTLQTDEVTPILTSPDSLTTGIEYEFVTGSQRFKVIERTKFGLKVLWLPIDELIGPDIEEWSWSHFCGSVIRPVEKW